MDDRELSPSAYNPSQASFEPPAPAVQQPPQIVVNDTKAKANYSNFCRLSGTPEEVLIDFGFNPQPVNPIGQSIALTTRVITGWHTAKRLMHVLQMTVERHEAAFGVLETDIQRRVRQ